MSFYTFIKFDIFRSPAFSLKMHLIFRIVLDFEVLKIQFRVSDLCFYRVVSVIIINQASNLVTFLSQTF